MTVTKRVCCKAGEYPDNLLYPQILILRFCINIMIKEKAERAASTIDHIKSQTISFSKTFHRLYLSIREDAVQV
jgi:hypothetical protein